MATTELAAWSNAGGDGTAAAVAYGKAFPGLKTFRVFSSSLPTSIENTSARNAHAAGFRLVASCKPPRVPTLASNATLDKWLASLLDDDLAANWHEPENDMDGPTFVKVTDNLLTRRDAAKPKLKILAIAMAYQYLPGKRNPADYYHPRVDGLAVDVYFDPWEFPLAGITAAMLSLENNRGFMSWYNWARTTGKPLYITELGISAKYPDDVRAQAYANAFQWAADHGFVLVSPWNDAANTNPGNPNLGPYDYWGGPTAHPLTAQVVRSWTAKNLSPAPAPAPAVDDTPWAAPITPDPTDRIKADQTGLGVASDGKLGDQTLKAFEAALAERDALRLQVAELRTRVDAGMAALSGSPK